MTFLLYEKQEAAHRSFKIFNHTKTSSSLNTHIRTSYLQMRLNFHPLSYTLSPLIMHFDKNSMMVSRTLN